jgi:hypothetical protein
MADNEDRAVSYNDRGTAKNRLLTDYCKFGASNIDRTGSELD